MLSNSQNLTVQILLDNGSMTQIYIAAGDALIDSSGVLHQFTLEYSDGTTSHFWLQPGHSRREEVVYSAVDFFARFGIKILAGKLVFKNRDVTNFAKFIINTYGPAAVSEVVEAYHRAHPTLFYFEMESGTRTYQGPITFKV